MRRLAWLSLVLALLLALAACGGDDDETAAQTGATDTGAAAAPINVFAAASLTEVFPAIDPEPTYNFAGSDELAAQIREGAPADVYAAASSKYPQGSSTRRSSRRPSPSRPTASSSSSRRTTQPGSRT
jgi:molybdate transport system substrate-binding protein